MDTVIKVAIVGVGNCASALYQGIHYYRKRDNNGSSEKVGNGLTNGIMKSDIGGYTCDNIEVVACIDVDKRKVGKNLKDAIHSKPNCTPIYFNDIPNGPEVVMGHVLDGVCELENIDLKSKDDFFVVSDEEPIDIEKYLLEKGVDILINYLPVGSQKATEYYAEICLRTKISLLNCIPVFIASLPSWESRFIEAGIPIIGDDMKSQFGASILSQMLQELAISRGHHVKAHIQRNVGGNTDFLNMTNQQRLQSKKQSKENVIRSQHDLNNLDQSECFFHAGPSEYIKYYGDNKIANIHLELEGFMGAPVTLDAQLSVIDSPNSAGVVIDAIRYLKVARELGIVGALRGPSAFTQKTPPLQMSYGDSMYECNALANRELSRITKMQKKRE